MMNIKNITDLRIAKKELKSSLDKKYNLLNTNDIFSIVKFLIKNRKKINNLSYKTIKYIYKKKIIIFSIILIYGFYKRKN